MEMVCTLPIILFVAFEGVLSPLNKKEATSLLIYACLFPHQKESSFFSLFPFNSFLLASLYFHSVEMMHPSILASVSIRKRVGTHHFYPHTNVFIPDTSTFILSIEPRPIIFVKVLMAPLPKQKWTWNRIDSWLRPRHVRGFSNGVFHLSLLQTQIA